MRADDERRVLRAERRRWAHPPEAAVPAAQVRINPADAGPPSLEEVASRSGRNTKSHVVDVAGAGGLIDEHRHGGSVARHEDERAIPPRVL